MIEQQARIVSVDGDVVTVELGAQSGCPACDAGEGCGAGIFGRLLRRKPLQLVLPYQGTPLVGGSVQLGLQETHFLRLVLRLYGMPLVAGLLASVLAHALVTRGGAGPGLADFAVALAGLGTAWLVLNFWHRTTKPDISLSDIHWLEGQAGGTVCPGSPALQQSRGAR